MAGTLFGLGLSQQFDVNGDPMAGAQLFIYLANSSTPVNVYKDFTLTLLHPYPILTDSTGRIPAFWLPDGFYRARLIDAGGMPQFDEAYMAAMGPSTGVAATTGTDPDGTFTTGDVKWRPLNANVPTGWVRMNGQTFGSNSSGADIVAAGIINQALFLHIWNNYSSPSGNLICPVVGGIVEGTALGAWNANRKITLLDMRGRGPFGFSDMGNVNLSTLFNGVPFTAGHTSILSGSQGGEMLHQLSAAELADHAHNVYIRDPKHTHTQIGTAGASSQNTTITMGSAATQTSDTAINPNYAGVRANADATHTGDPENKSSSLDDKTAGMTSTPGSSHNNVPLFALGTWYWRL